MIPIKIGSRVAFQGKDTHGTVVGFEICSDFETFKGHIVAHVKWDKGTDDWYKGEDLKVLE